MEARECRIGNWVTHKGVPIKVRSIIDPAYHAETTAALIDMSDIEPYEPIPLTEEILLKAGFEFKENAYYSQWFGTTRIRIVGYDSNYTWLWNTSKGTKLENLHQLQNLIFALTGEELNITL